MSRLIDLTGRTFQDWTVIKLDTNRPRKTHYICKCVCGNIRSVSAVNLKTGGSSKCQKCSGNEPLDLTNRHFGQWTVLKKSNNRRRWECQCNCGLIKDVLAYHLLSGASKQCYKCRHKSNADHVSKYAKAISIDVGNKIDNITIIEKIKKRHGFWSKCQCDCGNIFTAKDTSILKHKTRSCNDCRGRTGYKDISGVFWSAIKRGALQRKIKFDITIQYLWSMYIEQNKLCKLSGIPIFFYKNPSKNWNPQTASVDRIDSDKGYVVGNIQLVHKRFNIMKHNCSQEEFIQLCNLVAKTHNRNVDVSTIKFTPIVSSKKH